MKKIPLFLSALFLASHPALGGEKKPVSMDRGTCAAIKKLQAPDYEKSRQYYVQRLREYIDKRNYATEIAPVLAEQLNKIFDEFSKPDNETLANLMQSGENYAEQAKQELERRLDEATRKVGLLGDVTVALEGPGRSAIMTARGHGGVDQYGYYKAHESKQRYYTVESAIETRSKALMGLVNATSRSRALSASFDVERILSGKKFTAEELIKKNANEKPKSPGTFEEWVLSQIPEDCWLHTVTMPWSPRDPEVEAMERTIKEEPKSEIPTVQEPKPAADVRAVK